MSDEVNAHLESELPRSVWTQRLEGAGKESRAFARRMDVILGRDCLRASSRTVRIRGRCSDVTGLAR